MNHMFIIFGLCLFLPVTHGVPSASAVEWLPRTPIFPRSLADPLEPRMGLTYPPSPDHLDVSLGAPFPIARFQLGESPLVLGLEAGSFFRLKRDGSFFPLETFDGLVGIALETRVHGFQSRLRLMHWSGHKADGDTSVSFRGSTFSRETWTLDLGWEERQWNAYLRVGSSWHSVPHDPGLLAALGGSFTLFRARHSPFISLHLAADDTRSWRVTRSLVAGFETGDHRVVRFGVRLFSGHSPRGQYRNLLERYAGLEMQFSP